MTESFASKGAHFGWVSPRNPIASTVAVQPTVTFETVRPYADNNLPYDTTAVTHPAGIYVPIEKFGNFYLDNHLNRPDPSPREIVSEFVVSGSEVAPRFYVTSSAANETRIYVDGQFVQQINNVAAGIKWVKIVFPFASVRTVRIITRNSLFGGVSYPAAAAVAPPQVHRVKAALYGDSWAVGAGASQWYTALFMLLTQALNWEVPRMGHGGSGYVKDGAGDSVPHTTLERLNNVVAQDLDYLICIGSINDNSESPAAVQAAATEVYDYIAQNSPKTKIIVIGVQPQAPKNLASGPINDAVRAAALAAPNVVRFLDAYNEEWIEPGDTALMADGSHPNDAGYLKMANRFLTGLVRA